MLLELKISKNCPYLLSIVRTLKLQGPATVLVSCVEEKTPYRAHPHELVGKNCTKGVCKMEISPETNMTAIFSKLGIECVRKKDTSDSLALRKILNVDPFNQGVIM